jgi:hypothetical protein
VAPVSITASGDILKLYFQDTQKYAGIVTQPVLCRILKDFTIKFKAILSSSEPGLQLESRGRKEQGSKRCQIRIVVYGMEEQKYAVGNALSDADLFFQHPSATECPGYLKYCNPHYLLRPDSDMPKLEDLSLMSNVRSPAQVDEVDEVNRARLLRIFDFAEPDGSKASVTVDASPRLKSVLMRYVP